MINMLFCIMVGVTTYVLVLFFVFHDYIAEDIVTIRTAFVAKRIFRERPG